MTTVLRPFLLRGSQGLSKLLTHPSIVPLKNVLFLLTLYQCLRNGWREWWARGTSGLLRDGLKDLRLLKLAQATIPGVKKAVQGSIAKTIASVEASVAPSIPGEHKYTSLPPSGLSRKSLRLELERYHGMGKVDWQSGRVSGAVYHDGSQDLNAIVTEAYGLFAMANPLHPELFPGIRKMEAEVIAMTLKMFNSPDSGAGSVTSGGTESILMTIKAHRDLGRELKGIKNPEIVVPVTAHAAFDKGAHYFGVKIRHVPVSKKTGKVDLVAFRRAINGNTVLIVGSAPGFPHGIIDDLPALSKLAQEFDTGFHIDCCLGGFLVPFMDKAGLSLPHPCDFRLDGVTSVSVDTHKYAFAPKGSSVIMYRSKEIRDFQYFVSTEWPGGVYASPSMAGSRPGALIAGCWATLLKFGEEGYIHSTKEIVNSARRIRDGLSQIPHLRVIGEPLLSVIAFDATGPIKTYAVADLLSRKGWHLNVLQFPPAVHIACTNLTVGQAAEDLVKDAAEAVQILLKDPAAGNGELSAIYGTAASVPDRSLIAQVSKGFLDALTKI